MSAPKYEVGQEVVLINYRYTRRAKITKVGRVLVTIDNEQYRMDTGCLNDKNYGHQTYFRTIEEYAELTKCRELEEKLRSKHGLEFSAGGRRGSTSSSKLEQILAVLEGRPVQTCTACGADLSGACWRCA